MAVSASLAWLGRAGVIERFDIPGQRKRGTRLLNPDLRARDLPIDAAALREKDRRDRARLEAMVQLCYSKTCRQGWVLDYFGESHSPICGRCDICTENAAGNHGRRPGTLVESTWLRMALSGVARCCRKEDGRYVPRFGRKKIIGMLIGSQAADIVGSGLTNLSTHGLLKDVGEVYTTALFEAMEKAGLVSTEKSGQFPMLALTADGDAAMRGESNPVLAWPAPTTAKPGAKKKSRRAN